MHGQQNIKKKMKLKSANKSKLQ